ncbi:DUF393 domain-containing protein [Gallaecimonas kandeliae]|uniref:thiol-disulfide oxidoreductase DCC family protein n=1 Tax=Gallaecimonas kandeliae TaxID=3029055 RepID=UPI0026483AAB|nr:DUF393 domain-containing protein [Gallaecimonas kandeliae]WKE66404.1 DUF393 domain-containing protein [Gallaecimonas kandeliae]
MKSGPLIVYYDGACPLCRADKARFERWAPRAPVTWFDITGQEEALSAEGVDPGLALRSLHVRMPDGLLHQGMDAYALLMRHVWWLRPLGWLITLPGIKPLLTAWYRRWVDRRLCRQGRG